MSWEIGLSLVFVAASFLFIYCSFKIDKIHWAFKVFNQLMGFVTLLFLILQLQLIVPNTELGVIALLNTFYLAYLGVLTLIIMYWFMYFLYLQYKGMLLPIVPRDDFIYSALKTKRKASR